MTALRRFHRDRRGSVALEFALVFPAFVMLAMGTIELGLMMLQDATLEIAAAEASRSGSLSQYGTKDEREARVQQIVDYWMKRWIPGSSDIVVKTYTYNNLSDIGKPTWIDGNNNNACDSGEGDCGPSSVRLYPGIGLAGSLTLYSITVSRSGITGILSLAGITKLTFTREAVVLNE